MARSHRIYVVERAYGLTEGPIVIAAFTVKHELASWLKRNGTIIGSNYRIWSLPDGRDEPAREILPEELEG